MNNTEQDQIDYRGHYFGKLIRLIFILGGVVMLAGFPFFSGLIGLPAPLTLLAVIVLTIVGGLINPISKWVFVLSSGVSIGAVMMFEYYAYYTFVNLSPVVQINVAFFWVNQMLSLLFFVALYLSIRTWRGMLQGKLHDQWK